MIVSSYIFSFILNIFMLYFSENGVLWQMLVSGLCYQKNLDSPLVKVYEEWPRPILHSTSLLLSRLVTLSISPATTKLSPCHLSPNVPCYFSNFSTGLRCLLSLYPLKFILYNHLIKPSLIQLVSHVFWWKHSEIYHYLLNKFQLPWPGIKPFLMGLRPILILQSSPTGTLGSTQMTVVIPKQE